MSRCQGSRVWGLCEPDVQGPGSEDTSLPSLPTGLSLHFHAAPATFH